MCHRRFLGLLSPPHNSIHSIIAVSECGFVRAQLFIASNVAKSSGQCLPGAGVHEPLVGVDLK